MALRTFLRRMSSHLPPTLRRAAFRSSGLIGLLLLVGVFNLVCLLFAADDRSGDAPPEDAVPAEVQEFIQIYFKRSAQNDPAATLDLFDARVAPFFLSDEADRAVVKKGLEDEIRRWPRRAYTILPPPRLLKPHVGVEGVLVEVDARHSLGNGSRVESRKATTLMNLVRIEEGKWRIRGISEYSAGEPDPAGTPLPPSAPLVEEPALPQPAASRGLAGWKIALDIGHTRKAPGAISARGFTEHSYNVAMVELLRKRLAAHGAEPVVINARQAEVSLFDRARLAAEAGAHLFLSIHHDSVNAKYKERWQTPDGKVREFSDRFRGYAVFCSRKNRHFKQSRFLAERIGEAMRQAGYAPTFHHAEKIPGEGRTLLEKSTGVYEYGDLIVLKTAPMPAVLVECGVIVHRDEELELQTPQRRERTAEAICRALLAYAARHPKVLHAAEPQPAALGPDAKPLR
jgi:N-acetylmuramoyl-L-alanine amidase